jgi:hypothetical protein
LPRLALSPSVEGTGVVRGGGGVPRVARVVRQAVRRATNCFLNTASSDGAVGSFASGAADFAVVIILNGSLLGCAVPADSIILEDRPTDVRLSDSTHKIPLEWEGRLLRVSDYQITLGGSATHNHSISHIAKGYSGPASGEFQPLGLTQNAAAGSHVHLLVSQSQDPSVTGSAPNLPPSRVLLALISATSRLYPIEGQIVAYVGDDIPEGWLLCNGRNGTAAMQGRYIVLSRGANIPGIVGADTHTHSASFKHTWGVAEPDPAVGTNRALHLDYYPPAHPTLAASSLNHTHQAEEPVPATALVSVERTRPPTIEVRYIQATSQARSMPAGAVIPYVGEGIPIGWSLWASFKDRNLIGRFLAGSTTSSVGRIYGNESHTHFVKATHHVILDANHPGAAADVADKAPAVAAADHKHVADITETFISAPASHIPLYLSVRFIIKQ